MQYSSAPTYAVHTIQLCHEDYAHVRMKALSCTSFHIAGGLNLFCFQYHEFYELSNTDSSSLIHITHDRFLQATIIVNLWSIYEAMSLLQWDFMISFQVTSRPINDLNL